MAKVFHLKINEPENGSFYYPGSYIHGTVFLKVDKPLKIRGLRLKFKCVEHVYFQTPYEGRNSRGHSGTIEHFNEKITLLSDANGNDSFEFNGEACFPFSIRFSESTKLPMTLNVPGGSIVYSLKSYLDIPWRIDWNTRTYELEYRPIMLVNPTRSLDIDEIRESGCCFSSGPVGLKGKIYPIEHCTNTSVPIHIDFTISNHSKLTISRVFASIDIKKELWAGR